MPLAHRKNLPCRRFRGPRCRWSYLPCPQCGQGAEKKLPCPQCAYGAEKDSVPTARKKIARPRCRYGRNCLVPGVLTARKRTVRPAFEFATFELRALSPVPRVLLARCTEKSCPVPSSACCSQFCMPVLHATEESVPCPQFRPTSSHQSSDKRGDPKTCPVPNATNAEEACPVPRKRLSPGKGLPCPQCVGAEENCPEGAFEVRDALWSDVPCPQYLPRLSASAASRKLALSPVYVRRGKSCPVPKTSCAVPNTSYVPCPQCRPTTSHEPPASAASRIPALSPIRGEFALSPGCGKKLPCPQCVRSRLGIRATGGVRLDFSCGS